MDTEQIAAALQSYVDVGQLAGAATLVWRDGEAKVAALPLIDQPGRAFHNGHSTDLLGLLLARIEDMPLGDVLKRRIFDPPGTDEHVAYEWSTFDVTDDNAHAPGAVLSGPGDAYSYTVLRSDDLANNPNYEIVRAIVGVHIDDSDPTNLGQKWGSIKINGEAQPFIIMGPKDSRTPVATNLVEIISDATFTGNPGSSTPPYIYDVKAELEAGRETRITITNLRQDGSLAGDAPFGGFVVNRIGAHVWYKKR